MAQEVFERIEKKYLLPEAVFRRLLPELRKHMADDVYGRYTISNIYFDTGQFDLIRASLEKPVYKEKLRLRCYGTPSEDGKVFAEIKKKYKGIVYSFLAEFQINNLLSFPPLANLRSSKLHFNPQTSCL